MSPFIGIIFLTCFEAFCPELRVDILLKQKKKEEARKKRGLIGTNLLLVSLCSVIVLVKFLFVLEFILQLINGADAT